MKKSLSLYFAVSLIALNIFSVASVLAFTDVSTTYKYGEAVNFLYGKGVINGYTDGTYKPEKLLNRAEFSTIVMRALFGDQNLQSGDCFVDVHQEWFAKYVCRAKYLNIISGYPDLHFRPEKNINLAEALKILLEAKKTPLIEAAGEWYQKYIVTAYKLGGFENMTSISPSHLITRGEMAQLIYNLQFASSSAPTVTIPTPDPKPTPKPVPDSTIPEPTPIPPADPRFKDVKTQIEAILKAQNVPGASVAFVVGDKILWADGIGVMDVDSKTPVTLDTMFQAASISKPLTALAALRLVEKGTFSLDAIVDPYLKTTKIPGSDKITLRELLSHSAGTNIHGFIGYTPGDPIPTLSQILLGQSPANTPAIKVDSAIGTFAYSGGGYMVVQEMLMDAIGTSFPELMSGLVLAPLKMTHSTYEQPLTGSLLPLASSGHDVAGKVLPGKWTVLPEMAAAGLWTTPADLAKFVIAIQKSYAGETGSILTQATAQDMLKVQTPGGIGLGLYVDEKSGVFFHGGVNKGFKNSLGSTIKSGNALIIMTNSDNGSAVFGPIKEVITAAYLKK